jgi:hypothetical protein
MIADADGQIEQVLQNQAPLRDVRPTQQVTLLALPSSGKTKACSFFSKTTFSSKEKGIHLRPDQWDNAFHI